MNKEAVSSEKKSSTRAAERYERESAANRKDLVKRKNKQQARKQLKKQTDSEK